jgi:hypothetical protein
MNLNGESVMTKWNQLANKIAGQTKLVGFVPEITPITGHRGLIAVLWQTGPGGLPPTFEKNLKKAYGLAEPAQEVYGVGGAGGTRAMIVDEGDREVAMFEPTHAALVTAGGEEGMAEAEVDVTDEEQVAEVFARIAIRG